MAKMETKTIENAKKRDCDMDGTPPIALENTATLIQNKAFNFFGGPVPLATYRLHSLRF